MTRSPYPPVRLSPRALAHHYQGFVRSLADRRPETRGTYTRALREFLVWFPRQARFAFGVADVLRYKRHLSVRKRLASVSVATYLTALRRFFDYLVLQGVLPANPAKEVGGASRPAGHSRGTLTADDVRQILESVDRSDRRGLRDFAVLQLMVGCALSEIELVRADVGDLQAKGGGMVLTVQGKGRTSKDAEVHLAQPERAALDVYLAAREGVHPSDPLFVSDGNRTRGMRMTTRGIRDRVNQVLDRSGVRKGKVKKVSPYSLRHTAAVLLAAGGASPDEVRQKLRLGTVATAMLYYEQKT
jgi:integrase/recombinase XerC/integrase/recombinase XerD